MDSKNYLLNNIQLKLIRFIDLKKKKVILLRELSKEIQEFTVLINTLYYRFD